MKNIKAKRPLTMTVLMLLIVIGVGCFVGARIEAYSTQRTVVETLERMAISDFERATEMEAFFRESENVGYICYESDRAEMVLSFDESSGMLRRADSYLLVCPDKANMEKKNGTAYTEAQREEESLRFAQTLISGYQIGELEVTDIKATQIWNRYYIAEYYEGEPTGTTVTVAWEDDQIMSGVPHFGKIFTKDASGKITRNNSDEQITKDEAVATAIKAVEEYAEGYSLTCDPANCELVIVHGDYCFEVTVNAMATEKSEWDLSFVVILDAYTGEVLEIQQSV